MKVSPTGFIVTIIFGLLLAILPNSAIADSQIEVASHLDKINAVPFQPDKADISKLQPGPPPKEPPQTGSGNHVDFLTGPSAGDPLDIALAYIGQNRESLGLTKDDLADFVVKDRYVSKHNGVSHLYLRQRLEGIEVFNGDININLTKDGRVINLGNRFVPDLKNSVNVGTPKLSPVEALYGSARHLGLTITEPPVLLQSLGGPARQIFLSNGGISQEDIPVKLMYQPQENGETRLVWNMMIHLKNGQRWWNLNVDAVTGDVLAQNDLIVHDSYNVFPLPLEHPEDGPRTLVFTPANSTASPFGWHDINGVVGAEYTDTQGNNVFAQDDIDNNDSGGFRPDGGPGLVFSTTLDLNLQPSTYLSASIINLFYWNNILHDVHYQYGFDEASGNFQQNNYGKGGLGGDPVQADAQDGKGTNNAYFYTYVDGTVSRMEMFIWTSPLLVTVNSPPTIAGGYTAGGAEFGPSPDDTGITADLRLADDGIDTVTDGCEAFPPSFFTGLIAVIDRGSCPFVIKVENAQNAGAVGVIVVNNVGDGVINMSGSGPTITIPSVFIGQSDGGAIKSELPGVNVTIKKQNPDRDSALDNGIIIHEYGHGVSTRLTGGPSNVFCLFNQEQMGEGWSDWHTLALTAKPGDAGSDARGIGTYVMGQSPEDAGIRSFPYSTNMGINPQTYDDIKTAAVPHGVGAVWAQMLWEIHWNLVDAYGFDSDFYNGSGGNNLALQLVMDGLKLQPCGPSFVDGRDAILLADQINNGGVNQCRIWAAFAKRGLGFSADAGSRSDVTDGTEAFDLPPTCGPFDFTLEATPITADTCIPDNTIYNVSIGYVLGISSPVTLGTSGQPAGSSANFSLNPVTPPGTSVLTISNTGTITPGSYNIDITGVTLTNTHTATVTLNVASVPGTALLNSPVNGAISQSLTPTYNWAAATQGLSYTLEVAADIGLTGIVYSATVTTTNHTFSSALSFGTDYYWHVQTANGCGTGGSSGVFSFTTLPASIYGLVLSPTTLTKSADPGATITYTLRITNTGSATDTFDVAASGNIWTTTIPALVGPLAVGTGADVEVIVIISSTATFGMTDTVTITITSQGDNTKSSTIILTTAVPNKVFIPIILTTAVPNKVFIPIILKKSPP